MKNTRLFTADFVRVHTAYMHVYKNCLVLIFMIVPSYIKNKK